MTNEEKYIIARWLYSIGEEYISDIEYDRLEKIMKDSNLLPEYTSRSWSKDPLPFELLKKYNLDEYIVVSMYTHETESIESLNSMDLVYSRLHSLNRQSRVSYKLDGFSVKLNYYNGRLIFASLRNRNKGKTVSLQNIISLFKQNINLSGKVLITGELYLKNKTFPAYKNLRGIVSQRNGVSTAIANGDYEFLSYRCFNIYYDGLQNNIDKYNHLQELGFKVPKYVNVNSYNSLLKSIELLGKQKQMFDAPTDGLVIENDKHQLALRVNAWEEQQHFSYVTEYITNRGMYNDSVLVGIKPITLGHKTIKEIPVTNLQTIIDANLRIGAPIVFVERSAVNSIIDMELTEELQNKYKDRWDQFKKEVDKEGDN